MTTQELIEELVSLINEGYIDPHSDCVVYDEDGDKYYALTGITYIKDRVYFNLEKQRET